MYGNFRASECFSFQLLPWGILFNCLPDLMNISLNAHIYGDSDIRNI